MPGPDLLLEVDHRCDFDKWGMKSWVLYRQQNDGEAQTDLIETSSS